MHSRAHLCSSFNDDFKNIYFELLSDLNFDARVPRYLLPGARSSRLRDRQKEEREVLVKKAFIADILNQNKLLSTLISKNKSNYHAVLWDPEALSFPCKDPELQKEVPTTENISTVNPENNNNGSNLLDQISLYMETVNDLYLDEDNDDLACDFQVDSGTVACVACGVLGFPFMSLVQPSERVKLEILPADSHFISDHSDNVRSASLGIILFTSCQICLFPSVFVLSRYFQLEMLENTFGRYFIEL